MNILTPMENETLTTFYSEVENAQEQIAHHKEAMEDRNCINPDYHRDLISKWQAEENKLLDNINRIELNAKERHEKQTMMVI